MSIRLFFSYTKLPIQVQVCCQTATFSVGEGDYNTAGVKVTYASGRNFSPGVSYLNVADIRQAVINFKVSDNQGQLTDPFVKPTRASLTLTKVGSTSPVYSNKIINNPDLNGIEITKSLNLSNSSDYILKYKIESGPYGWGEELTVRIVRTMTTQEWNVLQKLNLFSKTSFTHIDDLVADYRVNLEKYLRADTRFILNDSSKMIYSHNRRVVDPHKLKCMSLGFQDGRNDGCYSFERIQTELVVTETSFYKPTLYLQPDLKKYAIVDIPKITYTILHNTIASKNMNLVIDKMTEYSTDKEIYLMFNNYLSSSDRSSTKAKNMSVYGVGTIGNPWRTFGDQPWGGWTDPNGMSRSIFNVKTKSVYPDILPSINFKDMKTRVYEQREWGAWNGDRGYYATVCLPGIYTIHETIDVKL